MREIGKERERIGHNLARLCCGFTADHAETKGKSADTADLADGDPGQDDDHAHFEDELEKVGDENAP